MSGIPSEEVRRKRAEEFHAEEKERHKKVLREILERHSFAVEIEDLDEWLSIIFEFNRKIVE